MVHIYKAPFNVIQSTLQWVFNSHKHSSSTFCSTTAHQWASDQWGKCHVQGHLGTFGTLQLNSVTTLLPEAVFHPEIKWCLLGECMKKWWKQGITSLMWCDALFSPLSRQVLFCRCCFFPGVFLRPSCESCIIHENRINMQDVILRHSAEILNLRQHGTFHQDKDPTPTAKSGRDGVNHWYSGNTIQHSALAGHLLNINPVHCLPVLDLF